MITYCSWWAGSRVLHVNQDFGEYCIWICDKEITAQLPQVSHLYILEVG